MGSATRYGRVRRVVGEGLEVRDALAHDLAGPGLVIGGERLDTDDVVELQDELERFLEERGRR